MNIPTIINCPVRKISRNIQRTSGFSGLADIPVIINGLHLVFEKEIQDQSNRCTRCDINNSNESCMTYPCWDTIIKYGKNNED